MRNSIVNQITEHAKRNKKVFLVTGDAGFGVLDAYRDRLPKRFLNLGVAEQNMIGFSAGMALAGYKVFVYNIIPFLLYRCYEQVRNDICYQRLPVTLIGIGSGITYAPQGITHYSVEDISIAKTLPNLTILSPADPVEAEACITYAMKAKRPLYIRVAKTGEPIIHKNKIKGIESPIVIKKGKGVAVIFHGSISSEVIKAAAKVRKEPLIISMPLIQPLNTGALSKNLKGIHTVITVEEHFVEGGLGSSIAEWIIKNKLPLRLIKLGIANEFIHAVRNNAGLRSKYGISCENIARVIEKAF